MMNSKNKIKILISLSFSISSLQLFAEDGLSRNTNSLERVEYTKPQYKNKPGTHEENIYEEFKLPERLREFEQPEILTEEAGLKLNEGIPLVMQVIYDKRSKNLNLTHQIGMDLSNTQLVEDVIDLSEYINIDELEEKKKNKKIAERYINREITKQELENEMLKMVFPVKSKLKPTRMPSARMELSPEAKLAVTTPVVFMGMDEYSLKWFQLNMEELKKFNPPIFITQVDSIVDLQQLKRIAPSFSYIPVQGDQALKTYGVTFYPVLITKQGIFQ